MFHLCCNKFLFLFHVQLHCKRDITLRQCHFRWLKQPYCKNGTSGCRPLSQHPSLCSPSPKTYTKTPQTVYSELQMLGTAISDYIRRHFENRTSGQLTFSQQVPLHSPTPKT